MNITWFGHAAFLIEAGGVKIVTDPYDGSVGYGPITTPADIVTVSHGHGDHNNVQALKGNPRQVKADGTTNIRGITFRGIATSHDDAKGADRGKNTIFVIETEGLSICHAGDLGHLLTAEQVNAVGKVDILLLPVGGTFTIDALQATRVADDLNPKLVVPMHYKTEVLNFPITGVEPFLEGKNNVRYQHSSRIEVSGRTLPTAREIVVLDHLL